MSLSSPNASTASPSLLTPLLQTPVRIITTDGRIFLGTFAGTDKPLNVLLVNTDEYRVGPDTDGDADARYVGQVLIPWKLVVKVEAFGADADADGDADEVYM